VVSHGADVVRFISTGKDSIFEFRRNEEMVQDLGSSDVGVEVRATVFGQDDVN